MKKPVIQKRTWTNCEHRILLELIEADYNNEQIARYLGRTPESIIYHRDRMGLTYLKEKKGEFRKGVYYDVGIACDALLHDLRTHCDHQYVDNDIPTERPRFYSPTQAIDRSYMTSPACLCSWEA